jgi:2-polyprenyl-6-hydroxyphenyl methylase / 3-demethylubiquinone-9 3-methyltransferase
LQTQSESLTSNASTSGTNNTISTTNTISNTNYTIRSDSSGNTDVEKENKDDRAADNDADDSLLDIVCLMEVIENVSDIPGLFWTASQLLKPQGLLFVSMTSPTCMRYLVTIVGAEYVMEDLPIGTR